MPQRKIIHIDMDAFYAAVEQRDFPELRGKAIAVGSPEKRGVIMTASYEARKFGIRSAMPSTTAIRKCPHLQFVPARFEAYREASQIIRSVFYEYTDLVEPLSLDEAYLDVSSNKKEMRSATIIAQEIKQRILEETQLTASAGVSYNKFLAKVASDIDKPNGLFTITPAQAEKFLEELPIEKFFGIGKVTAKKMQAMGIRTGADLKRQSEFELARSFGKAGRHYFSIVRGDDEREVQPDRIRKSISVEETFREDISQEQEFIPELNALVQTLHKRMKKIKVQGKTITLKIKHADFTLQTRSKSLAFHTDDTNILAQTVRELLKSPQLPTKPVRLLGVGMSNLKFPMKNQVAQQLTLDF